MPAAQGLCVGLTGGLGSGKSTAARLFAEFGAHILSADEIARELMQPGTPASAHPVFDSIVAQFGPDVLRADGTLDRQQLARLAFAGERVDELNAIIHPAAIARQAELAEALFARDPHAVVLVESALIFETKYGSGWRERFDRMILVTAPEALKIQRFITRARTQDPTADPAQLELEARRRLAQMIPDAVKAPQCDFVLLNDGTLEKLREGAGDLWKRLKDEYGRRPAPLAPLT